MSSEDLEGAGVEEPNSDMVNVMIWCGWMKVEDRSRVQGLREASAVAGESAPHRCGHLTVRIYTNIILYSSTSLLLPAFVPSAFFPFSIYSLWVLGFSGPGDTD